MAKAVCGKCGSGELQAGAAGFQPVHAGHLRGCDCGTCRSRRLLAWTWASEAASEVEARRLVASARPPPPPPPGRGRRCLSCGTLC